MRFYLFAELGVGRKRICGHIYSAETTEVFDVDGLALTGCEFESAGMWMSFSTNAAAEKYADSEERAMYNAAERAQYREHCEEVGGDIYDY